jgi:hypothetical protein
MRAPVCDCSAASGLATSPTMVGIYKDLEDALRDRLVVPLVGAGVSMAVRDQSGKPIFPSWSELLSGAAKRLREDGKQPEAHVVEGLLHKRHPDYYEAARYAREGMGPRWHRYLAEALNPAHVNIDSKSLALARSVWKLPSDLVVTTNYDNILRFALGERANDLVQLDVDATAALPGILRNKIERPTVWHMHGHINDPQHLILTPDGYRELYPSPDGEVRYRAALQALRHLLAARTFLFIGFSLDDELFGNQIVWVHEAFGGATGPHYMLVRARDLRETYRRLRNLDCIEFLTFEDFGDPLVAQVDALAATAKGERPVVHGAAPETSKPSPAPSPAALAATPEAAPATKVEAIEMASVRQSYRLVYQYQRCIFDRMTELSDALAEIGLEFQRWDPTLYSRHARSSSEFFRHKYWAWDFLPAYRLELIWKSPAKDSKISRSVIIEVASDTGFKRLGTEEPHPMNFEDVGAAGSELWVSLLRSPDPNLSWGQVWSALSAKGDAIYDGKNHPVEAGGSQGTFTYFQVDLDDVLEEASFRKLVLDRIRSWLDW